MSNRRRPPPSAAVDHHPQPPVPTSTNPTLTTTLYHTAIGLFALTWSHTIFGGHSFHLHLLFHPNHGDTSSDDGAAANTPSFHLDVKPFMFWNKKGSKKLCTGGVTGSNRNKSIYVHWDLSSARFGSGTGPSPESGYYIAVIVDGVITLLVGDLVQKAFVRTKSSKSETKQVTVLRREHVNGIGKKRYTTKAFFGGKEREISIDCCRVGEDDARLHFRIDDKRVLQVKHLQWKFRGNERIEVDGVNVQVSWDVYNWLFEEEKQDGYALFMFSFEKSGSEYCKSDRYLNSVGLGQSFGSGFGFGFERKKMKKGLLRAGSGSSSSLSSASSSCGSVMEWESVEENELKGPSGFSLLVYAWKR